MYGMVMTPISMLDAVRIVFITALNRTECSNCMNITRLPYQLSALA